jgi:hypothetical protein
MLPVYSDIVANQLPESVRDNDRFKSLLVHYYNWLSANGQPAEFIQNILKYRDIDLTNPEFRYHLTKSLLDSIPSYSKADRTLVTKHIAAFLKSKGNPQSIKFIMNAIYGEDSEIVWNSDKLFRPSANEYSREASLAIESNVPWTNVEGSTITQPSNNSSATIISCVTIPYGGTEVNWLKLDEKSITGKFIHGENVEVLKNNIDRSFYRITNYLTNSVFTNNDISFSVITEEGRPYDNLIIKQIGSNFRGVISGLVSRVQESNSTKINLVLSSHTGSFIQGAELYVFAPALEPILYTKSDFVTGQVSAAIVDVDITSGGSLYTAGDKVTFIGGSGELVDGYVSDTSAGSIETVNVLKKGYGYSVGDKLFPTGDGINFSAEVSNIDGINGNITLTSELNILSLSNGGVDYVVGDILDIYEIPPRKHISMISTGATVTGSPPANITVTSVNSTNAMVGLSIESTPRKVQNIIPVPENLLDASWTATNGTITSGYAAPDGTNTAFRFMETSATGLHNIKCLVNIPATTSTAVMTVYVKPIDYPQSRNIGLSINTNVSTSGLMFTPTSNTWTRIVLPATAIGSLKSFYLDLVTTGNAESYVGSTSIGFYIWHPQCENVSNSWNQMPSEYTSSTSYFTYDNGNTVSGTTVIPNVGNHIPYNGSGTDYPPYTKLAVIDSSLAILSGFNAIPIIDKGAITSIDVTSYPTPANGKIKIIANGYGATITPNIVSNAITSYTINTGGVNYLDPIAVITGNGTGANVSLIMTSGAITGYTINNTGSGYTTASVEIKERLGSGFNAVPLIRNASNLSGSITAFSYSNRGNYKTIPPCFNTPLINNVSNGRGALANLDFRLLSSNIDDPGVSYHDTDHTVPVVNGFGSGAILYPNLFDGVITTLHKGSGGSGYTYAYATIGGGTGFVGIASIVSGAVDQIVIYDGGFGYQTINNVTIVGNGTGASYNIPSVANGVIKSVSVVNGGSNYVSSTTISAPTTQGGAVAANLIPTIVNGVIKSVSSDGGSGYIQSDLANITINTGTTPTLSLTISGNGGLLGYSRTSWGYGYLAQSEASPLVISATIGSGATFIPTLNSLGEIQKITIVDGGSGYTMLSTISVSGTGSGANLIPIVYLGKIVDVTIISGGANYKYGTSAIIVGDGLNATVTPIVETGITSAQVLAGGSGYNNATKIFISDPTGTGAIIAPILDGDKIISLTIVNGGSGYTNPTLTATVGSGANLIAVPERFISSLNITNKGSGYTYADIVILGDGSNAVFMSILEKLGSIDSCAISNVGSGITSTPTVKISDTSGYGAVSAIRILDQGAGYKTSPILSLADKYTSGTLSATGTKFSCYGSKIGAVKKVSFNNNGAMYDEHPIPIFPLIATLSDNAAFKVGEEVRVLRSADGALSTNYVLHENSNIILYSQDFSQWTKNGVTVLTNVALAPDGTTTANKLTF